MANYYSSIRSNYFRVKDREKFEEFLALLPGIMLITDGEKVGFYENYGEGLPSFYIVETELANGDIESEEKEFDLVRDIGEHLADDEVCIVMEVGSEKMRYLNGWAIAFNNKGEEETVDLGSIYTLGKRLGKNITECSY